jgi:hypothetical protein
LAVCNNTQENMEFGWRFLLALKEMSNYLDIWFSTEQCICILLEVYVTSQGNYTFIYGFILALKKILVP